VQPGRELPPRCPWHTAPGAGGQPSPVPAITRAFGTRRSPGSLPALSGVTSGCCLGGTRMGKIFIQVGPKATTILRSAGTPHLAHVAKRNGEVD